MEKIITLTVFLDVVDLAKGVANIEDGVKDALAQDESETEALIETLKERIADAALAEEVADAVCEAQIEDYMANLKILKEKIEVNMVETESLEDRSLVAVDVPCVLDVNGLLRAILPADKVKAVADFIGVGEDKRQEPPVDVYPRKLLVNNRVGKFRVIEGERGYGQVCVDLVVNRNGREYYLPVAIIENPTDDDVETDYTRIDATTIYLYRTLNDDEWTDKFVIPNTEIDDAVSELSV